MCFADPLKFAEVLRAEPFNLSASFACELANFRKRPSLELAVKIERTLGIPSSAWIDGKLPDDAEASETTT
jgi:hypothetical protein